MAQPLSPRARAILLCVVVLGMVFVILAGMSLVYSFDRVDREERVRVLQRALFGIDGLARIRFRDAARAAEVAADLRAATRVMAQGHPDAAAFLALAEAVKAASAIHAKSPGSELEAVRALTAPAATADRPELIRDRAALLLTWLAEEQTALVEILQAEQALARCDFDAVTPVFSRISITSLYEPRVDALRDQLLRARVAVEQQREKLAAEKAAQVRAGWETFLNDMTVLLAGVNHAEARARLEKAELTVPEEYQARLRELRARATLLDIRDQAERAYAGGKGPEVLALLEARTEPELAALRDRIERVLRSYAAFERAETEGRLDVAGQALADLTLLEPDARVWYRAQAAAVMNVDPVIRAGRWLELARQAQQDGHLTDARRWIEAARTVHPGPTSEQALTALLSWAQKEFNRIALGVRKEKVTREQAVEQVEALMGALRATDKVYGTFEEFCRQSRG